MCVTQFSNFAHKRAFSLRIVSFFLFGEVFNTHWKMAVGSVIGILNPNFMKENNSEDISFTVDHHQKVLHIGSSKVRT